MMTSPPRAIALSLLLATWVPTAPRAADDPPRTGPRTEKRFPPLKVPPGFKATLFACDPLIEYPSVDRRRAASRGALRRRSTT